ncbi:MAG: hypothetical protein ACREQV_10940 [Candidatus Binatia bacterium]
MDTDQVLLAVAVMPEGTLRFSRSVLSSLGVTPDRVESIINTFAADDYAVMRGVGGVGPETPAEEAGVAAHRIGAGARPVL